MIQQNIPSQDPLQQLNTIKRDTFIQIGQFLSNNFDTNLSDLIQSVNFIVNEGFISLEQIYQNAPAPVHREDLIQTKANDLFIKKDIPKSNESDLNDKKAIQNYEQFINNNSEEWKKYIINRNNQSNKITKDADMIFNMKNIANIYKTPAKKIIIDNIYDDDIDMGTEEEADNIQESANAQTSNEGNEKKKEDKYEEEEEIVFNPRRKLYILRMEGEEQFKMMVIEMFKYKNLIDMRGKKDQSGNFYLFLEFSQRTQFKNSLITEYIIDLNFYNRNQYLNYFDQLGMELDIRELLF